MKKNEIAIKLTDKNVNKVYDILNVFGEDNPYEKLENIKWAKQGSIFHFYTSYWCSWDDINKSKKIIKPSQLREILAKEHLKKGDIIICSIGESNYIVDFDCFKHGLPFSYKWAVLGGRLGVRNSKLGGGFDKFIRYATDEEKALLEPNKKEEELVVGEWYVLRDGALINHQDGSSGYGWTATHKIWYNNDGWNNKRDAVKANPEQVKEALTKECIKRYGENWRIVRIKAHATDWGDRLINTDCFQSTITGSFSIWGINGLIFRDGKWAELLPTTIKPKLIDSDIAVIEQLHDTLLDMHGYSLDSKLLSNARTLTKKMHDILNYNK